MATATKAKKNRKLTPQQVRDTLLANTPTGWDTTFGDGYNNGHDDVWTNDNTTTVYVTFTNAFTKVVLNVTPLQRGDTWAKQTAFSGCQVEGHTLVDGCSFTRHGIDCSSCELVDDEKHRYGHGYGDLTSLLVGEYARCETAKARRATMVGVPGLPFSVQPEWFTKTAETLQAGKTVSLTPHGMGTGYRLSRRQANRWDTRASKELEAKLNVGPIYLSQLDCD